ncbi:MAG: hypothetical protein VB131_06490 [Burkholderia gladioli]
MTEPVFLRKQFKSRAHYADFARGKAAPRYSVIYNSAASAKDKQAFDLSTEEALFSDDLDALRRKVLRWESNGLRVYILDEEGYEPGWAIEASPSFPDLLEPVFMFAGSTPPLSAPISEVERIAREQLCDQSEHPLIFVDREDGIDALFLCDILNDPAEARGW